MPLAFSTLGCPGATLAQVLNLAVASGATGVELRAAEGEFIHPNLSRSQRLALKAAFAEAGLTVLALASYVRICAPTPQDGSVSAELRAAVDLAADLGAQNVRVFPGAGLAPADTGQAPSLELAAADALGASRLAGVASYARERGVRVLLETHDSHPRAADVLRILELLPEGTGAGVIWDLMHPWRHDEAPEDTARLLGRHLAYAQYKDGVRSQGTHNVTLTLPGHGELPLLRMTELASATLAANGILDPWQSLEWEKAWHPELPPLAEALTELQAVLTQKTSA